MINSTKLADDSKALSQNKKWRKNGEKINLKETKVIKLNDTEK